MSTEPRRCLPLVSIRILNLLMLAALASFAFLAPGFALVGDLREEAIRGPGIASSTRQLHRALTPRFEAWARERVSSGRAANAPLHDVPTTEWPMFTAVFYLMATDELQLDWQRGGRADERPPMEGARGAVDAARDLLLDPVHHSWVRTHWGDGYLHRENVFFRSLIVGGLTSYARLTGERGSLPMLRDQVETLATALDQSENGLLDDYPGECYPIDVLAAIGFIRRADAVLGTDHSAFVHRALRAFEGPMADELGLVPYRVDLQTGEQVQPSRGIGNSWIAVFAPELWPEQARDWYAEYARAFWQDRGWAAGFREFARGTPSSEWLFEIDAGPVLDGFGTSASAFGIAAARRNGRFDHAYTLSAQLAAASWRLPGGTLLAPRILSHAADAPYLGEAAILYFQTVQPADGVPVVTGGETPGLVYIGFAVYFGVSGAALALLGRALRRLWTRGVQGPHAWLQAGGWLVLAGAGAGLLLQGHGVAGVLVVLLAQLLPYAGSSPAVAARSVA
ncbi:MAG: hypothetical protein HY901_22020 [Deltaproteobacteria bacterium]|nr:hypothetical protein [Deltaproteobacteria bacterium]